MSGVRIPQWSLIGQVRGSSPLGSTSFAQVQFMDQDSTLFKIGYNTTIQFAGKTLSALLSALSIILITRYLGVSGYGEFSLIFAYLTFFVAFTDFGLQATIVN